MNKYILISICAVVAVAGFVLSRETAPEAAVPVAAEAEDSALVSITMPTALSEASVIGQRAFTAKCAACHGENGVGRKDAGPPLIHKVYEPSHHGDEAFQRAAAVGVRAHHWKFGDMPPVEGITRAEVASIVAFIREVQRQNGIE